MRFFTTAIASLLLMSTSALPSTPHPTFCGMRGYDYFNKPYDVQQDSRIRTLAQCRSQCLSTSRCNSYALGKGACVLYDYDTFGTFVPYDGSHYLFYDRACDPESSPTPSPTPDPDPIPPVAETCSVTGLPPLFICGSGIEVYGYIQILDSNTNEVLGYVNHDISPYNIFQMNTPDKALIVKATYTSPDCSDPTGIALELRNAEGNSIQPGYIGSAGSFELSDSLGSYGYSPTTSVSYVPSNVPGEYGSSADGNAPVQSSIWTIDLSCGVLTSTLINDDESRLETTQILDYADCPNGCLYQTRSEAAYYADHPRDEDVVVVKFKFLPLL